MALLQRYQFNPVLTFSPTCPWSIETVTNPAVVYDKKHFHMLFTAGGGDGALHLGYASSKDGIHFQCRPEPFFSPSSDPKDFDRGTVVA